MIKADRGITPDFNSLVEAKPQTDSWFMAILPKVVSKIAGERMQIIANKLTARAIEKSNLPHQQSLIKKTFLAISDRAKQSEFTNSPEFALAVYTEVVPELLAVHGLSERRKSSGANNSFEEYVDVVETILRAETTSTLIMMSPICANYDIRHAESHDADAYSTKLAPPELFNQKKVDEIFHLHQVIASVCEKYGINTFVITPQVDSHPHNIPALVPASFWAFVEDGDLANMFVTLDRHATVLPAMIQESMNNLQLKTVNLAHSLTEANTSLQYDSSMEMALNFTNMFVDFYNLVNLANQKSHWMELSVFDLRRFIIGQINDYPEKSLQLMDSLGWDESQKDAILSMVEALTIKNGCLDETEAFYHRYYGYRPPAIDIDALRQQLLTAGYHHDRVETMIEWSLAMANIKVGGRALFNEVLYFAMGIQLSQLNSEHASAIMIPLGVDDPVWEREAMERGYAHHRQFRDHSRLASGSKSGPIVYQKESLRQPFI